MLDQDISHFKGKYIFYQSFLYNPLSSEDYTKARRLKIGDFCFIATKHLQILHMEANLKCSEVMLVQIESIWKRQPPPPGVYIPQTTVVDETNGRKRGRPRKLVDLTSVSNDGKINITTDERESCYIGLRLYMLSKDLVNLRMPKIIDIKFGQDELVIIEPILHVTLKQFINIFKDYEEHYGQSNNPYYYDTKTQIFNGDFVIESYPEYLRKMALKAKCLRALKFMDNETCDSTHFNRALEYVQHYSGLKHTFIRKDFIEIPKIIFTLLGIQCCKAPDFRGRPKKSEKNSDEATTALLPSEKQKSLRSYDIASSTKDVETDRTSGGYNYRRITKSPTPSELKHLEDKKIFMDQLKEYMWKRGTPIHRDPTIASIKVDLYQLYAFVQTCGGYDEVVKQRQWKTIFISLGGFSGYSCAPTLTRKHYERLLLPYERYQNSNEAIKEVVDTPVEDIGSAIKLNSENDGTLIQKDANLQVLNYNDNKDMLTPSKNNLSPYKKYLYHKRMQSERGSIQAISHPNGRENLMQMHNISTPRETGTKRRGRPLGSKNKKLNVSPDSNSTLSDGQIEASSNPITSRIEPKQSSNTSNFMNQALFASLLQSYISYINRDALIYKMDPLDSEKKQTDLHKISSIIKN